MHTYRNIPSPCIITLIALILCGAAMPALAHEVEPSDPPVVRIETRDLRLDLASDQKRLDRRIAYAARTVCRDWQGLPDFAEYGRCIDHARNSASIRRNELVERAVQQDEKLAQLYFFLPERHLTADEARKSPPEDASR